MTTIHPASIPDLRIAGLRAAYRGGRTPAAEIGALLDRVESCDDPAVWISRFGRDELLQRAEALQHAPGGAETLPLYGIPFAVKDNIEIGRAHV